MTEDSFKNLLYGVMLFILIGTLTLTAVNTVGNEYGKDMADFGSSLNTTKFNSTIANIDESAQNFRDRFDKGDIFSVVAGVVVDGVFGIMIDVSALLLSPFDLLFDVMVDVLHIPPIITTVLLAILVFSIIFGIWTLIKLGN